MSRKKEPIDYLKIIKIIDPVLQTLLIIYAFYVFDRRGTRYHAAMVLLLRSQVFSIVVNFFLKFPGKLKWQRLIALTLMVGWLFAYNYFFTHGEEKYFYVILGKGPTRFAVFDSILMISGISIAIWYFNVSVREVNKLIKKRRIKRG